MESEKGVLGFGLLRKGSVELRFGTIPLKTAVASEAILF